MNQRLVIPTKRGLPRVCYINCPRYAGIDILTIKDLGRWQSLEMEKNYLKSLVSEPSPAH